MESAISFGAGGARAGLRKHVRGQFVLELSDGLSQPARNNGVSFFLGCSAIKKIQRVRLIVQRNVAARKLPLSVSLGDEVNQDTLVAGLAFTKISEIHAGGGVLKNKLWAPCGFLWSDVTAAFHECKFPLKGGEHIFL